ncbi:MAG: hypothetical protein ACQETB_05410 [Halobacteriota archaeon]
MNVVGRADEPVSFEVSDGTVRVSDELGGEPIRIDVDDMGTVQPALPDRFVFPVDDAVSLTASRLVTSSHTSARLRNERGEDLGGFTDTPRELPRGTYCLDLHGGVKLFVRIVDSAFSAAYTEREADARSLEVTPESTAQIVLGARSFHTRPIATITVPDDPIAVMEGVSYLASSIKEFSAERSWMSLRGHPPRIERGTELDVPSRLRRPETGIRIATPATYADVYRITPLAFYLGATIERGDLPTLVLENGHAEPLGTDPRSTEAAVDRLLARCFLLDTLTRVGGYFSIPRYEYEELGPELPFYPPNLQGLSLSEQLMEYLEVPFETIEPYVPSWPVTAILRPDLSDVELLPYLCHSLARIHVAGPDRTRVDRTAAFDTDSQPSAPLSIGYTGTAVPAGGTRLLPSAFENAFAYERPTSETVTFGVVTDEVDRARTLRARFETDRPAGSIDAEQIDVHASPSVDTLRGLLESGPDCCYCELPTDSSGFVCADGTLDPASIASTDAAMVAVGGSDRLDPLVSLVDAGLLAGAAIGSKLSIRRVVALVDLLYAGLPINQCVSAVCAIEATVPRFFGDPTHEVLQIEDRSLPFWSRVSSNSATGYTLKTCVLPTADHRLGCVGIMNHATGHDQYHLAGTCLPHSLPLTAEFVFEILEEHDFIGYLDDRPLFDLDDLTVDRLQELAASDT